MTGNIKGNIYLVLAALIWGVSFVAQDRAAMHLETFTINSIRSIIGTLTLLPLILIRAKKSGVPVFEKAKKARVDLIVSGVLCGCLLAVATNLQQFGISLYPSSAAAAGRSGFITALYVILVPLCGLFMHKKIGITVWSSVVFATVGMFLLCFSSGVSEIYIGDIVILICAFAFCFQILCVDKYAERVDGVKLSALQFFVCGIISLILMLIFDTPTLKGIYAAALPVLYIGVMSCGVAYTLQIIGQQHSQNPTVASILMSLESVFAALGGVVLSGERFTSRELIGCIIMFAAIILSQLPSPRLSKKA